MNEPLELLLADGVIDEVLGRLKSGKEADISLVRRGDQVVAAKIYKDRATRSFKNNADYKEGRKIRNSRTQRAIAGGSKFGRDAAEEAWKSAEAYALSRLAGNGVRVPTPIMFYEGVLLMELVRDADGRPAPRLIDVAIEREAVLGVYADLVAQIIAMLCCDVIHGDLSPYNILAGADGPTIIDFPQMVSASHSSRAEYFFMRDFANVHRFLCGFDPALAAHGADGRAIWRAYVSRDLTPQFVPPPPPPARPAWVPDRRPRPEEHRRPQPQGPGQRLDSRPQAQAPRPQAPRPQAPRPQAQAPRPQAPRPQAPRPQAQAPRPQAPRPHHQARRPETLEPARGPGRTSSRPGGAAQPTSRDDRRRPKRRF